MWSLKKELLLPRTTCNILRNSIYFTCLDEHRENKADIGFVFGLVTPSHEVILFLSALNPDITAQRRYGLDQSFTVRPRPSSNPTHPLSFCFHGNIYPHPKAWSRGLFELIGFKNPQVWKAVICKRCDVMWHESHADCGTFYFILLHLVSTHAKTIHAAAAGLCLVEEKMSPTLSETYSL